MADIQNGCPEQKKAKMRNVPRSGFREAFTWQIYMQGRKTLSLQGVEGGGEEA